MVEESSRNAASSAASSPIAADLRCDYCLMTADRVGRPREDLLVCFCCMAKAHPSCMDYSEELAARTRRSPWQCIDCKTCSVCSDPGDADAMLFCDACDKGYHMACHDPAIPEKPNGKWICRRCRQEESGEVAADAAGSADALTDGRSSSRSNRGPLDDNLHSFRCTIDGASGLPTPCHSPIQGARLEGSSDSRLLADVPDASEWSIDDIRDYFTSIGFAEQAKAFVDQEIDGRSLLLLKRKDVLTGLALKLGPALKIYSHVRRLQMKHEMLHSKS